MTLIALSASKLSVAVDAIRLRWAGVDRWDGEHAPLSRAEVLRVSESNAEAFNLPTERRGPVVYVDISSLQPVRRNPMSPLAGNLTVLAIDRSFLPDLKRLAICVKDGRVYARNFRETRGVGWGPHLTPLTSIVGAKKYKQQEWDVTFLTAHTRSGDSLDLRRVNVVIPCLEDSIHTQKMNEALNKGVLTVGWNDGNLADKDALQARPKRPAGAAPDEEELDFAKAAMAKMQSATDGQRTESDASDLDLQHGTDLISLVTPVDTADDSPEIPEEADGATT
jgi:hypothetical protein